jgi:3-dehydroquinate synthase
MKVVEVNLGKRSYQIFVRRGSIEHVGKYVADFGFRGRCFLITNETVGQIYAQLVERSLEEEGFTVKTIEVEDSERVKSLSAVEHLYREAYNFGLDRSSPVIALGGGVVGDLSGFMAATYMRGLPFFQVPTSLLAQVDSSVGGKVAVNYFVKNLIGCFYQPRAVIIDPATLDSLPAREFRAGMGEVIKYGVIWDAEFFDFLNANSDKIKNLDPVSVEKIICRACEIKSEIVSRDEMDYGIRGILNLGHTFGHALEAAGGFGGIKHGEAVAAGLCIAARISVMLGLLSEKDEASIKGLVKKYGLPSSIPGKINYDYLVEVMTKDKKNKAGLISVILPTTIGRVEHIELKPEEIGHLLGKAIFLNEG